MSSLMKQMMDDFYSLSVEAKNDEDYQSQYIFRDFESFANNGHGKNPAELIAYLDGMVEPYFMAIAKNGNHDWQMDLVRTVIDSYR